MEMKISEKSKGIGLVGLGNEGDVRLGFVCYRGVDNAEGERFV
jgi:hypothetical protein